MKDVYFVAVAVENDGVIDAAGILITANQNTDENTVGLAAAALLPSNGKIESMTVDMLNDATLRAIGLIALARGLL